MVFATRSVSGSQDVTETIERSEACLSISYPRGDAEWVMGPSEWKQFGFWNSFMRYSVPEQLEGMFCRVLMNENVHELAQLVKSRRNIHSGCNPRVLRTHTQTKDAVRWSTSHDMYEFALACAKQASMLCLETDGSIRTCLNEIIDEVAVAYGPTLGAMLSRRISEGDLEGLGTAHDLTDRMDEVCSLALPIALRALEPLDLRDMKVMRRILNVGDDTSDVVLDESEQRIQTMFRELASGQ